MRSLAVIMACQAVVVWLFLVHTSHFHPPTTTQPLPTVQTPTKPNKIHVAILIPVRLTGITKPWSFLQYGLKSIVSTIEPERYQYTLILGVDETDSRGGLECNKVTGIPTVVMARAGMTPFTRAVNRMAEFAVEIGADYMTRLNDDTRILTPGWTTMAIASLRSMSDVGVVGPTHREGNTGILVFDFVSKRHFEIHGFYYPPELSNWWADDWITNVYADRTRKLRGWRTRHVGSHGVRYKINTNDSKKLQLLVDRGKLRILDALGDRPNVISYSLYGSSPWYTDNALVNANLSRHIYKGWEMRVYHDDKVPGDVLSRLSEYPHVRLVRMTRDPYRNPMVWRFLVASDPTVERYIIRDIDSWLSVREHEAVVEWTRSGRLFHIMRDHPSHSMYPISGGMWGGTRSAFPGMATKLLSFKSSKYLADMNFLNKMVWAEAKKDLWQNDAFSCDRFGGGHPFPVQRRGLEHVGGVYIDGQLRKADTDILARSPTKCPEEFPACSPFSWFNIPQNKDLNGATAKKSGVSRLLDTIPNPPERVPLLVDVGANMGHFSTALGARWPQHRLVMFEAIPWYASSLKSKFPSATVHNAAVSNVSGTMPIYGESGWRSKKAFHTGSSLLIRGSGYKSVVATVKTTTLDKAFPTETIHFLKIDTEGMDARVLVGGKKMLREHRIRHIFWENNKMQSSAGDNLFRTLLFLRSFGYTNHAVGDQTLYEIDSCPGNRDWFHESAPTGNVLSRFRSGQTPYPVTIIDWKSCSRSWSPPTTWYVVTSSDTNTNYLGFLPSVTDHWKSRGMTLVLALVLDVDEKVPPLPDGIIVHRLVVPPGVDKGHAAKLARLYMASRLSGLVTIVDIDYYLMWFDDWVSHFGCTEIDTDGMVGLGYNRYSGTPDQGKFPMYLTTARGSTFTRVVGDNANFSGWISKYRRMRVFDTKESPYGSYGTFSDESLLRAELSTANIPVTWITTPSTWRRIDRSQSRPLTRRDLVRSADVFPNRPIDNCKTYKGRLEPVHRFLGISNPARDAMFLDTLRHHNIRSREWGSKSSRTTSSLTACLGRLTWTGGPHPGLEIIHRTPTPPRESPNKYILRWCSKLNHDIFWECRNRSMPCSTNAFVAAVDNAFVSDNRMHADVPGTIFTDSTTFRWQAYVRDVPAGPPRKWRNPPTIVNLSCVGSVLQAYPGAMGHFPHETLPRLLYLRSIIPPECPIIYSNSSFVHRYTRSIDNLLPWRPKTVYHADKVYVANEEPFCTERNPHNGGMSTFFQPFVMNLVRERFNRYPSRGTTVVIKRTGTREYKQHSELVDILRQTREVVVFDASGTLDDHIRIFQEASTVIGPHGAGFSNLVFCHRNTTVIEIGWDGKQRMEMDNMYARVSTSLGLDYRLVLGKGSYTGAISLDPMAVVGLFV